jgi:hypothetical protein
LTSEADVNYDQSDLISLSHSEEVETGYNAVQVIGRLSDIYIPTLELEDLPNDRQRTKGTESIVRVYWAGHEDSVIDTYVTDGLISVIGSGAFYTEDLEETLEFKEGHAPVNLPIYDLLGYEWIGDSGKSITYTQYESDLFLEDGDFRVAKVKYRVRYQKYTVNSHYVDLLIAALFLNPAPNVVVTVRTTTDPVYGSPIEANLLTTESAAVARGKVWIDEQYRKSEISIESPYDDDAIDGNIAYINDSKIGDKGNYHIESSVISISGPRITNMLKVTKCQIS